MLTHVLYILTYRKPYHLMPFISLKKKQCIGIKTFILKYFFTPFEWPNTIPLQPFGKMIQQLSIREHLSFFF
jgi:hypothetical protein